MSTTSLRGDATPNRVGTTSRVLTGRDGDLMLDRMRERDGTVELAPPERQVGLSIRQPWAELILAGRKTIEVRSWRTDFRGTLWIHAAQKVERKACTHYGIASDDLPRGAIVGRVVVEDCMQFDRKSWEALQGSHLNIIEFDRPYFGWVLRRPQRVDPVAFRGALGLMTIPPKVLKVRRADG